MIGYRYVLADQELSKLFESLDLDRVEISPAIIWNRQIDKEFHTHHRIRIGQFFSPDQINDLNLDGDRLLIMNNESVFVSPGLKERLECAKLGFLRFTKGLSEFVANAT